MLHTEKLGGDGIEVRVQDGTIWLSQKQMGILFDTSSDNIGLHLKNIFKEEELSADSVTEEFSATAADGKNYCVKNYNLDAVIAVGYREILTGAGRISAQIAKEHAESEFEKFSVIQDKLFESDFDRQLKLLVQQIKKTEEDDNG